MSVEHTLQLTFIEQSEYHDADARSHHLQRLRNGNAHIHSYTLVRIGKCKNKKVNIIAIQLKHIRTVFLRGGNMSFGLNIVHCHFFVFF